MVSFLAHNETMQYFSDHERGTVPQTATELTPTAWGGRGIAALIRPRIDDGSFGARLPDMCPDEAGPSGTDVRSFWETLFAEIPSLSEHEHLLFAETPPALLDVMDMIEFCWNAVGKVERGSYHSYFQHHHLDFDLEAGKVEFREAINRIFQRNGLAYALTEQGRIERLIPTEVGDALHHVRFQTGDAELDGMLETARRKFLDPDEAARREALEKLWDAWERLKTVGGADKKNGIASLLDKVAGTSGSNFRMMLEKEAKELTDIGNTFQIRHSETSQERLNSAEHVDYMFHRLFSLIHLILCTTGRD